MAVFSLTEAMQSLYERSHPETKDHSENPNCMILATPAIVMQSGRNGASSPNDKTAQPIISGTKTPRKVTTLRFQSKDLIRLSKIRDVPYEINSMCATSARVFSSSIINKTCYPVF
uniref:Putative transmembrane protein n=1 Tax=Escherichia coli O25b:H4-ST131 TaxID=941322 RepID=M1GFE6_ECOLX|nr:putative transmembrane protein [Escherichia coli O25b:H4-ST131]